MTDCLSRLKSNFFRIKLIRNKYKINEIDIDAFLHCNDLTYLNNGEEDLAKYKKGDKIKVKVLENKPSEQKIDDAFAKNMGAKVIAAVGSEDKKLLVSKYNPDLVVNYHIAHDSEVHIHRIGRTGRAGAQGKAISIFSDKESYKVGLIEDTLEQVIKPELLPSIDVLNNARTQAKMSTIQIDGGKKQKVRPGDILGALTSKNTGAEISGKDVGKINVLDIKAYVAVNKKVLKVALRKLANGKMKGRNFKVRHLTV